jgi:DUF971 family protein
MIEPPNNIRARQAEQELEIVWADGRTDRFSYRTLRAECPCASCRDEWTGERIIQPASIRPDLRLEGLELVGNYAVQPKWNDGHSSGLFTWELLQRLATGGST